VQYSEWIDKHCCHNPSWSWGLVAIVIPSEDWMILTNCSIFIWFFNTLIAYLWLIYSDRFFSLYKEGKSTCWYELDSHQLKTILPSGSLPIYGRIWVNIEYFFRIVSVNHECFNLFNVYKICMLIEVDQILIFFSGRQHLYRISSPNDSVSMQYTQWVLFITIIASMKSKSTDPFIIDLYDIQQLIGIYLQWKLCLRLFYF